MSTWSLYHTELWIISLFLYVPHYRSLLTIHIIWETVDPTVQDWDPQFELPNNMQYINTPDGLCYFKGSLTL